MSDYAFALDEARKLKAVMLRHGIPEVSIELQPGRPNSHGSWYAIYPVAEMSHHTVSRYNPVNLTPVLALCKRGRSDLPGPLCNGYGGWDLTYRIITMGYANHPGRGGPLRVPTRNGRGYVIPKDSARRYVWGTEYEGGLSEADWDKLLTNPRTRDQMTFREFMGRANAALVEYLEVVKGAHLEHSSWTSRKIDRLGYTRAGGIAELDRYTTPAEPPTTQALDVATWNAFVRNRDQAQGLELVARRAQELLGRRLDVVCAQEWKSPEATIGPYRVIHPRSSLNAVLVKSWFDVDDDNVRVHPGARGVRTSPVNRRDRDIVEVPFDKRGLELTAFSTHLPYIGQPHLSPRRKVLGEYERHVDILLDLAEERVRQEREVVIGSDNNARPRGDRHWNVALYQRLVATGWDVTRHGLDLVARKGPGEERRAGLVIPEAGTGSNHPAVVAALSVPRP